MKKKFLALGIVIISNLSGTQIPEKQSENQNSEETVSCCQRIMRILSYVTPARRQVAQGKLFASEETTLTTQPTADACSDSIINLKEKKSN